ncbi:hypothetical protein YerA41_089 [Yersinia phage YerA41]|nr:hypothetical protein YerA41_089 [Yersinia phage YerA41]
MGSSYELAKSSRNGTESDLTLHEMSCKFSLTMNEEDSKCHTQNVSINDLSPDEVRDIALRMIQSASYFTEDPDEFMESTKSMLNDRHINSIPVVTKE